MFCKRLFYHNYRMLVSFTCVDSYNIEHVDAIFCIYATRIASTVSRKAAVLCGPALPDPVGLCIGVTRHLIPHIYTPRGASETNSRTSIIHSSPLPLGSARM
jgi:hypothetical protein